jgi:hypothetical protein
VLDNVYAPSSVLKNCSWNKKKILFYKKQKNGGQRTNPRAAAQLQGRAGMDLLVRHKSAAENVDQTVEAETQDHMDHTYGCLRMCGTRTRMVQRKLTAQRGDHCPAPTTRQGGTAHAGAHAVDVV